MKEIPLTQGKVAIVDDDDFDLVSRFSWHCHFSEHREYAMTDVGSTRHPVMLYLHRLLVKTARMETVDHINGNTLDNRKCNLRICTAAQNLCNRGRPRNNKSGFKGVSFNKKTGKWKAAIGFNKGNMFLGLFADKLAAARAYDAAALQYHGEFAKTNQAMGLL